MLYARRLSAVAIFAAIVLAGARAGLALPVSQAEGTLDSAIAIDEVADTIVLPLHEGLVKGRPVWYILTDMNDFSATSEFGVNYSPFVGDLDPPFNACSDSAHREHGMVVRHGAPNFAAVLDGEPLATAGDDYAPMVSGIRVHHTDTHARVTAIDVRSRRVTLRLSHGYSGGREMLYFCTEASDASIAHLMQATYAPALANRRNGSQNVDLLATSGSSEATVRAVFEPGNPFGKGDTPAAYSPTWTVRRVAGASGAPVDLDSAPTSTKAIAEALRAGTLVEAPHTAGDRDIVVNCPFVAFVPGNEPATP